MNKSFTIAIGLLVLLSAMIGLAQAEDKTGQVNATESQAATDKAAKKQARADRRAKAKADKQTKETADAQAAQDAEVAKQVADAKAAESAIDKKDPCDLEAESTDAKLSFDVSVDYYFKYIFRGMNLTDDPVAQGSVAAHYQGLTALTWGNLDFTEVNDTEYQISETNYLLQYRFDLSDKDIRLPLHTVKAITLGGVYYDFPNTEDPDTAELFWKVELDGFGDPRIEMYHDIDEASGTYGVLGFGHTFDKLGSNGNIHPTFGLDFGMGSSHFNEHYWGVHNNKLTDMKISFALPIEHNGWTISPQLIYARVMNDSMQATHQYNNDSDHWYGGVSFSVEF